MVQMRPPQLQKPISLRPTYFDAGAYQRVSLRLYHDDLMYWDNAWHYLSAGASALNVIKGTQSIAAIADFARILDFGSGAGRVSRWLRAAYPAATLTVAEVRAGDLQFCAESFGAETWNPGTDFDAMQAPGVYDLIWVGSVITHLSETNTTTMLRRLTEWLAVGGVAIASFHGRSAYSWRTTANYITADALPEIERSYEARGYGYNDYPGQSDLGISFCSASWMTSAVERMPGCRLVTLGEAAWDQHHDVVAIQRTA
jgi:2-polyprenyl-3-methyl-5-hydroxy-6-metoxy-1,4-benzoquinol methylase